MRVRPTRQWLLATGLFGLLLCATSCSDSDEDDPSYELRQLTHDALVNSSPTFHPDGRSIYFSGLEGLSSNIWKYDSETGSTMQVTSLDRFVRGASFSPDGSEFAAFVGGPGCNAVWLFNADGGNPRPLGLGDEPAWAPSGNRILIEHYLTGTCEDPSTDFWGLITVDAVTQGVDGVEMGAASAPEQPTWSPDGTRICYQQSEDVGLGILTDLWIVDASGGTPIRITDTGNATSPDWSPDGRWIAFVSDLSIDVIEVATGERRLLVEGTPGRRWWSPQWSPDGTQVVIQSLGYPESDLWLADHVESLLR